MQRRITRQRRSDEEAVKDAGLLLDFDEIARKGKMSKEETFVGKWYGIYNNRQPGYHMARVVVPAGVLTTAQVRALARISEKYAQGRLSVTTRQAIQLHWLRVQDLPAMMRDLRRVELSTYHGCGDVSRNVVACPWAENCPHARFDVATISKRTADLMAKSRDLDNLPRKFKISFSGCGSDCAQPHINCVGLTALIRRTMGGGVEEGFRVVIGGGMGWKAFVAEPLYSFVPRAAATRLCRAVGQLYRDHGDRYNRATSRLKFVVHRRGIDECRRIVEANLDAEGVDRAGFRVDPIEEVGEPAPARPFTAPAPLDREGLAIERVMIPRGEMGFHDFKRMAELSEQFGDKFIHTTNRQNLEIHGVDPGKVPALRDEVEKLGFRSTGFFGLDDIVPCVGTTYCPLAVTRTRDLYDRLTSVVGQPRFDPIRDAAIVNITGCPNSCSPYRISDIGFRGMRLREDMGSVEGYEVLVGGTQTDFGRRVGDFKTDDCPRVTEALLDAFLRLREGEETLAASVRRLGVGPYLEAVAALGIRYEAAAKPAELSVFAGEGRAPLDRKTVARDVPCQEACPAKTNVPEYIRLIARKDYDGAYRINQEDNVFPGVLGRVCTRPCEDRCRHQWTNTNGPVTICHLKRSAADRKSGVAPLPPWFDDSGRRVAVIGGGPAGLTAARELRRYGHTVSLFEREQELGGMMRWGIPAFRLPRRVIDEEIEGIVASGIDVRPGEAVDRVRFEALLEEFDAVLVATGAMLPQPLRIEGLPEGAGVSGLEFMWRYNTGRPLPVEGDVVIVGGGFTAVDCARAARRIMGKRNRVTAIMYRRGEEHMSASPEEIWQLRHERIDIGTLVNPRSVRVVDGKVQGVVFDRNLMGDEPEDGGKPPVFNVPDSAYEVPCDTLIYAIGQVQDFGILPEGIERLEGNRTSRDNVFVAGDFGTNPEDVISAVADAKRAADLIDERLTGERRRDTWLAIDAREETGRLRDHDLASPAPMPTLPVAARRGDGEVELGHDDEDTDLNAWRCYLCNYKFEIDQDKCIHCDWCINVSPRSCIHRLTRLFRDEDGAPVGHIKANGEADATYIWIDSDQCIRCGACERICPVNAISLRKTDLTTCARGGVPVI